MGGYDGLGMQLGWVLHDEELCDWYRSVGVVIVAKFGWLRWAGNVEMCVIFLSGEVRI